MKIFLGPENVDKTTALIQYTYDYLLENSDESLYGIIITSKSNNFINDMIFGKYESVNKKCLDRIHIKFLDKYEDLLDFFTNLLYIEKELYPSIIAVDRINIFLNLQIRKNTEELIYPSFVKLHSILENMELIKESIQFLSCIDIDLDNFDYYRYNYKVIDTLHIYFIDLFYFSRKIDLSKEDEELKVDNKLIPLNKKNIDKNSISRDGVENVLIIQKLRANLDFNSEFRFNVYLEKIDGKLNKMINPLDKKLNEIEEKINSYLYEINNQ
jgi:hypothetical protein